MLRKIKYAVLDCKYKIIKQWTKLKIVVINRNNFK